MINGLWVILKSSEGRVITSHTHTVWLADEVSQRGWEDSDEQEMKGAASRSGGGGGGLAAVWASPLGLPGSFLMLDEGFLTARQSLASCGIRRRPEVPHPGKVREISLEY